MSSTIIKYRTRETASFERARARRSLRLARHVVERGLLLLLVLDGVGRGGGVGVGRDDALLRGLELEHAVLGVRHAGDEVEAADDEEGAEEREAGHVHVALRAVSGCLSALRPATGRAGTH
jgi:hypothetical protein